MEKRMRRERLWKRKVKPLPFIHSSIPFGQHSPAAYLSVFWSSLPSLCLCSASSSSLCARDLIHLSIVDGDDKMVPPPTLSLHLLVALPLPSEMTVEVWELEHNLEDNMLAGILFQNAAEIVIWTHNLK